MKKAISGLLALILILGLCAGCGNSDQTPDQSGEPNQTQDQTQTPAGGDVNIYTQLLNMDPSETALESDGNQIPMELYLYWLTYSCSNLEYQLNMFSAYYGMYTELVNEDGSILWDGDLEGQPAGDFARQQAEDNALSYAIIENVAAKHNISLTAEDNAQLAEDKAAYIEQLGGQEAYEQNLREMGISEASFDRVSASGCLYQHLLELAQDPSSDLYQAPTDDDAYVDHILLMTTDSETGEPLSEEEIQAKREQAEDLLAQLQASDDVEALFTQLAEEYCEDPGRASETGYLINPDTNFVQEFKDAAFALKPGEISGIVESDYGYHILLRKELTEAQLTTVADENLAIYMDSQLEAARDTLVRSDKLDGINVGEFFAKYKEAVEAMYSNDDTQPAE
ncbi:MAG: hypothetical protein HDT20_01025 [Oscillibacter sp.]|nr:hypothetical protein [Oscillibacter sp.]